jgi:formate/nitrite transporter FocA (FNT family)
LRRVKLVIAVAFCIELGLILVVLPWTRLWTENSLLLSFPTLRSMLHQNFVRGLISGVGLIDVWLGVWEAVRYRESRI